MRINECPKIKCSHEQNNYYECCRVDLFMGRIQLFIGSFMISESVISHIIFLNLDSMSFHFLTSLEVRMHFIINRQTFNKDFTFPQRLLLN